MTKFDGKAAIELECLNQRKKSVLEAEKIEVRFGGVVALSKVDVDVPFGSIVGLIGPNGAGKSTLLAVLSGLQSPDNGCVRLNGMDVTRVSSQSRAHRGMARTFQHPELFADLTIREHLLLAHRLKHSRKRLWTDLWLGGGFWRADPTEATRVNAIIDLLRLGPISDQLPVGLPLGIARIVELGRALATNPAVILLDEPASGLDTSERHHLGEVLLRITKDARRSLLLVEHDVDMVMQLCELVYVLDFGLLIGRGTPSEIRLNPDVQAAYLGDFGKAAE